MVGAHQTSMTGEPRLSRSDRLTGRTVATARRVESSDKGGDMGIIKGAMKTGLAMKAIQVAKREMSKPENQAKAREAFARFQQSRKARKTF